MELQTKNAAVEIKTNSTPGEFTAVISAIGNVDRQGDRVMPGAFKSAIDNDPIPPVYWAHMHHIPPIGSGFDWCEKGNTVEYKGALFVEGDDSHQYAQMVYAGMKERNGRSPAINQFSYTYGVPDEGSERVMEEGKNIRLLHEVRPVAEVGPCFMGANPDTYLISPAKSAVSELVVARRNVGRRGVSMKQLLADTLGLKDYGDIDGYEIRMLLDMLDAAVSFIQFSNEDDDTVKMQGIATTLLGMLQSEFAEVTDLMAQGHAIDAILNPDLDVSVTVDIETASTTAETEKLEKKDDAPVEVPAAASEEAPAAASETSEAEEPEVEEPAVEAAAEEPADASAEDTEDDPETPGEDVSKSDTSVSSDDPSTVSNDDIARLVNTWPSH